MIAHPGIKIPRVEQFILGAILDHAAPVSEISRDSIEIEQKYIFLEGDNAPCEENSRVIESNVRAFFHNKQIDGVAPFDGVDYCFNITKGETMAVLRYRTGFPVDHRLGIKIKKTADGVVRTEIEFQICEDVETEKVLSLLRVVASLGESSIENHVRTRGNIRNQKVVGFGRTGRKIEVVVCVYTNIRTGKALSAAEIEAHGFDNELEARAKIIEYERLLQWEKFRTTKSASQLLE